MSHHWRTAGLLLSILLTMALIAAIDSGIYVGVVAISVLVLPPANWAVAGILLWTSRRDPSIRSLRDAADTALTLAINSSAAADVGAIIILRTFGVLNTTMSLAVTVLLGYIVVTLSLPAARFLQTWRDVWAPMALVGKRDRDADDAARQRSEPGERAG